MQSNIDTVLPTVGSTVSMLDCPTLIAKDILSYHVIKRQPSYIITYNLSDTHTPHNSPVVAHPCFTPVPHTPYCMSSAPIVYPILFANPLSISPFHPLLSLLNTTSKLLHTISIITNCIIINPVSYIPLSMICFHNTQSVHLRTTFCEHVYNLRHTFLTSLYTIIHDGDYLTLKKNILRYSFDILNFINASISYSITKSITLFVCFHIQYSYIFHTYTSIYLSETSQSP